MQELKQKLCKDCGQKREIVNRVIVVEAIKDNAVFL